jgi:hypothetical protein
MLLPISAAIPGYNWIALDDPTKPSRFCPTLDDALSTVRSCRCAETDASLI